MIDFNLEIKKVQPISIEDMESNQYEANDNIKKAVILYNKAVAEIKIKDLDSAIKDLKKALSYNDEFVEGIKLLGLCYVNNKEYRRAEKTFKELSEYELYSDLAIEYIKNSIIERTMSKTMKSIKRYENSSSDSSIDNKENNKTTFKEHHKKIFIIGASIAISIAVFTISYLIGINLESTSKKSQVTSKAVDSSKNKIDETSKDNESKEDTELNKDIKNVQKEDSTKFEEENNKDEDLLETDKLPSDMNKNNIWNIYNEGNSLYKQGKYGEALPKLKIAYEVKPDPDLMPWITYQIGNCYKEANDHAKAIEFFQRVKDNYPNSQYVSSAERMINQIESNKANRE